MHDDDRPVGPLLSRRELVALFGVGASAAAMAARASGQAINYAPALATPDCVAQPRQTEGPYFVDEQRRFAATFRVAMRPGESNPLALAAASRRGDGGHGTRYSRWRRRCMELRRCARLSRKPSRRWDASAGLRACYAELAMMPVFAYD